MPMVFLLHRLLRTLLLVRECIRLLSTYILNHLSFVSLSGSLPLRLVVLRRSLSAGVSVIRRLVRVILLVTRTLLLVLSFFFNDPPTPEIYPLPLHVALPILLRGCLLLLSPSLLHHLRL